MVWRCLPVWVEWEFSGRGGLFEDEEVDSGKCGEGDDNADRDPECEVGFFAGVLGSLKGGGDLCGRGGLFGGASFLSECGLGRGGSGTVGGWGLEVVVCGWVVVSDGGCSRACGGTGRIAGVSSDGGDRRSHAEYGGVVVVPFFDLCAIGCGGPLLFGIAFGGGCRGCIVPRGLITAGRLAVGEGRCGRRGLLNGCEVRASVGWFAAPDGFVVGIVVGGVGCCGLCGGLHDGLCGGGWGIFLFFHLIEFLNKLLQLEGADGFAPILDKAFDIPLKFAGGLVAFIAVFGERAVDDGGEFFGEVGSVLLDGDGAGVEDGP